MEIMEGAVIEGRKWSFSPAKPTTRFQLRQGGVRGSIDRAMQCGGGRGAQQVREC